ncbi:MAG: efflux RND transporter permease subunit [Eubacteriales bacterium]|nr:efflux RND transporter permease subunit [Eubacteriales bacterium]
MNLTKLVLKRPVSTALVVLGIIVFGFFSIPNFDMELIPQIDLPMYIVYTVYPGASPTSIDELVTSKIEDSAQTLSGVDTVSSYSYDNYCMVALTYDYDQNMNDAYTSLSAALDVLSLPDDCQDPVIIELDVNQTPTVMVSATAAGSSDLMAYINETVVPAMEGTSNVARVEVSGGRTNYVRVRLDEDKMRQYGLNISGISQQLGAADYNVPAGRIKAGTQQISLSTSAEFLSIQNLEDTTLSTATGALIRLADVARISMDEQEASSVSRYNGEENVTIEVYKVQSASTVRVASAVRRAVRNLEKQDAGVTYDMIYDSGAEIVSALKSVAETLALGVVFAMLVLFIFFGDLKASLIVGSSMPLSVFATLVIMFLLGFDLNIITTGALVIAIGMIVDNSIVVLESCFRATEEGEDLREAAVRGAGTVMMSIAASTITTCVVYLPLTMIKGLAGQMFSQLGVIIVVAMLASLISALCIIPLLYVTTNPREKKTSAVNGALDAVRRRYDRLLRKLLYRKKTTLLVSVLMLIFSFYIASTLQFELIPADYDGSITITADFRPGTRLEVMDEEMQSIEQMVRDDPYFENYSLTISGSTATVTAYAVDKCGRTSEAAVDEYTAAFSSRTGADIAVAPSGGSSSAMSGSYSSDTVDIVIQGEDVDTLAEACGQIEEIMANTPGVIHVTSDAATRQTAGHVIVDPRKAAAAGLAPAQVALDLYQTMNGVTAAHMEIDGSEYDIILNYADGAYEDVNQLMGKTLTGAMGNQVTLQDIAEISYDQQLQTIQKTGSKIQNTVSATPAEGMKGSVTKEVNKAVEQMELPEGVERSSSLLEDSRNENLTAILYAILAGIFLVFLVMAMQFESPRFSLMVMTCIPFSLIGSFLLLFVTGSSMNMVSMMGFLMLMGIAVNNGILLVDTVNQEKGRMPLEDALVEAGKIRIRPILMTTLTTILAMVPMGWFSDNKMMSSMAFVIIGGLVASTILCLLMMPSYYLIISKKEKADISGDTGAYTSE